MDRTYRIINRHGVHVHTETTEEKATAWAERFLGDCWVIEYEL